MINLCDEFPHEMDGSISFRDGKIMLNYVEDGRCVKFHFERELK